MAYTHKHTHARTYVLCVLRRTHESCDRRYLEPPKNEDREVKSTKRGYDLALYYLPSQAEQARKQGSMLERSRRERYTARFRSGIWHSEL